MHQELHKNTTLLILWDWFSGQERFGNMTRVYYKDAVGAFIVFDVTRSATFDAVMKWKQDLDSKVQLPNGSPIPCILIANKVRNKAFLNLNSTVSLNYIVVFNRSYYFVRFCLWNFSVIKRSKVLQIHHQKWTIM